jgi:hypothetical protein
MPLAAAGRGGAALIEGSSEAAQAGDPGSMKRLF